MRALLKQLMGSYGLTSESILFVILLLICVLLRPTMAVQVVRELQVGLTATMIAVSRWLTSLRPTWWRFGGGVGQIATEIEAPAGDDSELAQPLQGLEGHSD